MRSLLTNDHGVSGPAKHGQNGLVGRPAYLATRYTRLFQRPSEPAKDGCAEAAERFWQQARTLWSRHGRPTARHPGSSSTRAQPDSPPVKPQRRVVTLSRASLRHERRPEPARLHTVRTGLTTGFSARARRNRALPGPVNQTALASVTVIACRRASSIDARMNDFPGHPGTGLRDRRDRR